MLRSYKQVVFLSLVSYGACVSSASVSVYNSSFSGRDLYGWASFDNYTDYWRSNFGSNFDRNIEYMDWNEDHGNDFQHGSKKHGSKKYGSKKYGSKHGSKYELNDFFDKGKHDHVDLTNPYFPYDKFPFGGFSQHDFPSDHYPDKFCDVPSQLIEQKLSSVPVPAAVWLFGSGFLGLIGIGKRRNEKR